MSTSFANKTLFIVQPCIEWFLPSCIILPNWWKTCYFIRFLFARDIGHMGNNVTTAAMKAYCIKTNFDKIFNLLKHVANVQKPPTNL